MPIKEILESEDLKLKRSLFSFDKNDSDAKVIVKFNLWGRKLFIKYFKSSDAPFHNEINKNNLAVYRGAIDAFVDIAFRGAGKDMKTKLFIAFCVLNDLDHSRRYFKVLSEDGDNSTQSVTDIYNILMNPKVLEMYPETFEKSAIKREERMSSFTTSTGIKVTADTVGVDQRGANQEETRPDFIWFNDFETRKTLRSARETKNIWENMEEARTGLEKGGGCIYTCNYISEQGNVHKLVTEKLSPRKVVLILPIYNKKTNEIAWPSRYTMKNIEDMKVDDDDFEGERMCEPSASKDIYFDRSVLDKMEAISPLKEVGQLKIFKNYNPSHRYAGGHDVAGGLGLDSSTSVFIDFDMIPAQVVATFANNEIAPESFGDQIYKDANRFGGCLVAPENNKYDTATFRAKQLGAQVYKTQGKIIKIGYQPPTTYGWNTNGLTKGQMLSAMQTAIEDGLISLNDKDLIQEFKSYTRNDLIDTETDPRMTTRHFDLLIACCIAWQMRHHAKVAPRHQSLPPGSSPQSKPNPAL